MLENRSLIKAFGEKETAHFTAMKGLNSQEKQKEDNRSRPQEAIYHAEKKIQTALENARKDRINGQTILQVYEYLTAERLAVLTRLSIIERLVSLSRILNKPFSELSKEYWNQLVVRFEREGYADWTIYGYGKAVKKVLECLGKDHSYVKCRVRQVALKANDMVSQEDLKAMLSKATTPKDRAFLLVLFESGFRIGELLTLKIGSIQLDQYGAKISAEGKTGSRAIRLVASYEALMDYLRHHPYKDVQDSWLWLNDRHKMMKYSTANAMLKQLAQRAGITKRIYNHLFRHSAVSRYSKQMKEAVLDLYFGWKIGSNMPSRYTHLDVDETVDQAVLAMHGLKKEEGKEPAVLKCPRCRRINSTAESICKCGFCFDPKLAVELEKEKEDAIERLEKKYAGLEERLRKYLGEIPP